MTKIFAMGVLKLNFNPNSKLIEGSRLWGLYESFEDAEQAVLHNYGDIFEYYYNVACIEEHNLIKHSEKYINMEEVYHLPQQWWYLAEYTKGKDSPIIRSMGSMVPTGLENTVNIWVG